MDSNPEVFLMRAQSLLWVVLALSVSSPAVADGPAPGFSSETLPFAPSPVGVSATLEGGDVIVYDVGVGVSGTVIKRVTYDGLLVQTYKTFPFPGLSAGFVAISPDESFAVVGTGGPCPCGIAARGTGGGGGGIYRIDIVSGSVSLLTSLIGWDAVIDASGSIYVSAGPAPAPSVYRVDSTTGDTEVVAQVPSDRGVPVALDAAGNLLLGILEYFPTNGRIVRYTPAQLSGGTMLSESDGVLVSKGWESLDYLVVDQETGSLFVAEFGFPPIVYRALATKSLSEPVFVAPESNLFGKPQLATDSSHPAVFRAFQPELGGEMIVPISPFGTQLERLAVRPARPTSHVSGPGVGIGNSGIVTYAVEGAYPGGAILLRFGRAANFDPLEKVYIRDPEIPPIFWGLKKIGQTFVQSRLPVDQTGKATFTFFNPGLFGGSLALQSLLTDSDLVILGSAPAVVL